MQPSKLLILLLLATSCGDPSVTPFDLGPRDVGDAGFVNQDGSVECQSPRTVCGSVCVDTNQAPDHCGECFMECTGGTFCQNGVCDRSCSAPLSACGGSCVDLARDPNHCGRCDLGCDADKVCLGGNCECPQDTLLCNGVCVDEKNDPNNCGLCERSCRGDQMCENGSCECEGGFLDCNGVCVDQNNDETNCGICERQCAADEFCNAGSCTCTGGDREAECGDNTDNDCDTLIDCDDPDCVGQTRACTGSGGGMCSMGTETCESLGVWGQCVIGGMTTEICGDGIDQDCNGSDLRNPDSYEPNGSCTECYQLAMDDPNLTLTPMPSFDSVDDNVDCFKFNGIDNTSPFREFIQITLDQIPTSHDYDVYLYQNLAECEARNPLASSTQVGNVNESINWGEDFGGNDDSTYYIRVRRFSGYSCTEGYRLVVNGLN